MTSHRNPDVIYFSYSVFKFIAIFNKCLALVIRTTLLVMIHPTLGSYIILYLIYNSFDLRSSHSKTGILNHAAKNAINDISQAIW